MKISKTHHRTRRGIIKRNPVKRGVKLIGQLQHLQLVDVDYDVQAVKDIVGKEAEDYDGFLVREQDGDYAEVWGFNGTPYLNNYAHKVK